MAGYGGGGYGYVEYFPGGGLDAAQDLTGPGSTAYEAYGPYSSYARESDRGGIYEQNVTDTQGYGHHGYVATSAHYSYHGADYSYFSSRDTRLSGYAGYSQATEYSDTSSYHASSSVAVEHDGLTSVQQYSTSYYTYADGTYTQISDTHSFEEENGSFVQGSGSGTHSSVSGYIGGYGGSYYSYGSPS